MDCGSTCRTQLPPVGPRLLRAKALFGDIMRTCKKEVLAYAKYIPPQKLRHVVPIVCEIYNCCRPLGEDSNIKPMVDCIVSKTRNQSSLLYTKVKLSPNFGNAARDSTVCLGKVAGKSGWGLQTIDDGAAVGVKFVYSFGWT
ncbi:uncharacterized protein [Dermacentor albipictus]|uniref:uncharacterized protein n=1 Tax=Dermacentor albipictus TaxID=60249 RepID=UPI0038FD37A4